MCTPEQAYELYLVEWYSGWRHVSDIGLTVGTVKHTDNALSNDWIFGRLLFTDDLNIVLSNLQAYAARDHNIDMMIGHTMSIEQLLEAITSPGLSGNIYRKAIEGQHCVALIFQEAMHFRSLLFDPEQKVVFFFDSLNIVSDVVNTMLSCLARDMESQGWIVKSIGDGRQHDSWSCGLWAIFSVLLTLRYRKKKVHMSLGDYVFSYMIQEQQKIKDLPRALFDHFEAGIRLNVEIGMPVGSTQSDCSAVRSPFQLPKDIYVAESSPDEGLWKGLRALKRRKPRPARISKEHNLCLSNQFEALATEACEIDLQEQQLPKIEMTDEDLVSHLDCVKDWSTPNEVEAKVGDEVSCVSSVRGHVSPMSGKALHVNSIAQTLTPLFEKLLQETNNDIPKFAKVFEACAEWQHMFSEHQMHVAWKSFKRKLRAGPSCKLKCGQVADDLFPVFDDLLQENGDNCVKAAQIIESCFRDVRCKLTKPQISVAWQRYRKVNSPAIISSIDKAFETIFQGICKDDLYKSQSLAEIADQCMLELKTCKFSQAQTKSAWYRFLQRQSLQLIPKKSSREFLNKESHETRAELQSKKGQVFEHQSYLDLVLKSAGFLTAASLDVKLVTMFINSKSEFSSRYNPSQIRNAIERWLQQHAGGENTKEPISGTTLKIFAAALKSTQRYALGVSPDVQRELALDLFEQPDFQHFGLQTCYGSVQQLCKQSDKPAWNGKLNKPFMEVLSSHYPVRGKAEDLVRLLRNETEFFCFSSKQLLPRVHAWIYQRKSGAMQSQYSNKEWSDQDSQAFHNAIKAVKLDFSKFNLREWTDRIVVRMEGTIATQDVMRRLFDMQKTQLELEGVQIETENGRPDFDDIAADADWEEQRISLVQAAALFSEKKLEGPTRRCGCCGQLHFESTMTRYSNKSHAAQCAEVQGKLEYMTASARYDNMRFCCSTCIASLSEKRIPSFCFGQDLPHNAIPESVASLTDLEAELCSPRIAFAKIYQLRLQKQKSIRGAVINVPANYSTSQRMLPRSQCSELKVQIDLKRKLEMKNIYKTGLTRPSNMMQACKDLEKTPLYIKEGVEVVAPEVAEDNEDSEQITELPICNDVTTVERIEAPALKCKRHINDDGFEIVSDDEELSMDEAEPAEGGAPTETFMDLDTEANELKQQVFAVAPGEGKSPSQHTQRC